ncbi:hypothetical protein RCH09_003924 [Actimicrobium sp. GrIS 1.19]|nr:hypothetical protein [Actimicrobium sp. GrIS 1.19]
MVTETNGAYLSVSDQQDGTTGMLGRILLTGTRTS